MLDYAVFPDPEVSWRQVVSTSSGQRDTTWQRGHLPYAMEHMTPASFPTSSFVLSVKAQGPTVLPAGSRDACGFAQSDELRARSISDDTFIVESHDAILVRLRSGRAGETPTHGVEEVARLPREADAARGAQLMASPQPDDQTLARREAEMTQPLGLSVATAPRSSTARH